MQIKPNEYELHCYHGEYRRSYRLRTSPCRPQPKQSRSALTNLPSKGNEKQTLMADPVVQEAQKIWVGGELLLYAGAQLVLVSVAYRIDRQHRPPLISTSSWAILFGLVVRCSGCLGWVRSLRLLVCSPHSAEW
jgi:hypothetical protein